jgi:hypothetical protein
VPEAKYHRVLLKEKIDMTFFHGRVLNSHSLNDLVLIEI